MISPVLLRLVRIPGRPLYEILTRETVINLLVTFYVLQLFMVVKLTVNIFNKGFHAFDLVGERLIIFFKRFYQIGSFIVFHSVSFKQIPYKIIITQVALQMILQIFLHNSRLHVLA